MAEDELATSIFERIVCGVDDSPASLDAVRQAVRLRAPDGSLHLLGAVYIAGAVAAGWSAEEVAAELEREAGEALTAARSLAGDAATARLINGPAVASLLAELASEQATLVCVGTHGMSRPEGIVIGGVATTLLHEAPCGVLVARPTADPDAFPGTIAVGLDGSREAGRALAAALELGERLGSEVRAIVASRGKEIEVEELRRDVPGIEVDPRHPVEVLVDASGSVDLLVLGSRGLHGMRALGSVSERVAHRARCSVLVARPRV